MNPNQMIYFNALVLQHDFRDDGRRSREAERTPETPPQARVTPAKTKGGDHDILGFLGLALPGRR